MQTSNSSIFSHLSIFVKHPQARSLALMFLAHGMLVATWVAQIPAVKTMLDLNDAELGRVLLGLPLGISIMNPIVGYIMQRFGSARTALLGFVFYVIAMNSLFYATTPWMLFFCLLIAGSFTGILIVSVNTMVTRIEAADGILVLSSCHGTFSLGAMLGTLISSFAIGKGIPATYQMMFFATLILMINFANRKHFEKIPEATEEQKGSNFGWPSKELWLLIIIGLSVAFGEGVVNDWSAVYLRDVVGASPEIATYGYGGCALSMMIFRFGGDSLLPRFGAKKLLFAGGILAFVGLLLAVMIPVVWVVILGFTIVGAGVALGVPMLINMASKVKGFSDGAAVGIFSACAFFGFVIEPPIVGWIGETINLKMGLLFISACCLLGGFLALRIK